MTIGAPLPPLVIRVVKVTLQRECNALSPSHLIPISYRAHPLSPSFAYGATHRRSLQRGWSALRQATHRRAILVRLTRLLSRSRSQFLRVALHRWRVAATEIRAAQARAQAQRSVLAASLAGARVRNVQPAFAAWSHLVARESEEEDEFADHGDGLLRFAVLLSRVGERRDRARTRRALVVWRLGAAQLAVLSAQQEAKVRGDLASAAELEKVRLLEEQRYCKIA